MLLKVVQSITSPKKRHNIEFERFISIVGRGFYKQSSRNNKNETCREHQKIILEGDHDDIMGT